MSYNKNFLGGQQVLYWTERAVWRTGGYRIIGFKRVRNQGLNLEYNSNLAQKSLLRAYEILDEDGVTRGVMADQYYNHSDCDCDDSLHIVWYNSVEVFKQVHKWVVDENEFEEDFMSRCDTPEWFRIQQETTISIKR